MKEEWRPIPIKRLENYEASNLGRIRSKDRIIKVGNHTQRCRSKILKSQPVGKRKEYLCIAFTGIGCFRVNRLVAFAFHGKPTTSQHHAAHWDRDTRNNRAENLRWATPKENHADMVRHGTRVLPTPKTGENHHRAKITATKARSIRKACSGEKGELVRLAKIYGLHPSTVADIRDGKIWKTTIAI